MADYKYEQLKSKYADFNLPMVNIQVNGKELGKNKQGFLVGEVEVELTSGYEAGSANYYIYNCVDTDTGEFQAEELKPYILLGSQVQIELGYGGTLTEVFRGFIAQVRFLSEEREMPGVSVTVMDIKGIMMANSYAKQMQAECYSEAVKEIFDKAPYQKLLDQGIVEKFSITDTPDKGGNQNQKDKRTIEMVSESDYEFVVKAAKRCNYEFFIEKGTVYFRKAKKVSGTRMELVNGQGLLAVSITYDIRGLVQSIEVRGMDSGKGEAVRAKKKFNNKISQGNKAKSLIAQTEKVYIDSSIRTKEEAEWRASSLMETMSFRFGEMEGVCVGIPELLPGYFVEISGNSGPGDNRFYLVQVRHVINSEEGYRTFLTGIASGL